jgi:hypothetical protein
LSHAKAVLSSNSIDPLVVQEFDYSNSFNLLVATLVTAIISYRPNAITISTFLPIGLTASSYDITSVQNAHDKYMVPHQLWHHVPTVYKVNYRIRASVGMHISSSDEVFLIFFQHVEAKV